MEGGWRGAGAWFGGRVVWVGSQGVDWQRGVRVVGVGQGQWP